jgi:exodeoxyribonuclease X
MSLTGSFFEVSPMNLIVLDTETTDLDPDKGAQIVELAWVQFLPNYGFLPNHGGLITQGREYYIQHTAPMSPQAQAVHHIPSEKLTVEGGAITKAEAIEMLQASIDSDTILVAHNSAFDSKFLPELTNPWICTRRLAQHIWPGAPGYSNQVLRYWLGVEPDPELIKDRYPHQALYDVATTTGILFKMLERYSLTELLRLSTSPIRLQTLNFGKYRGMNLNTVPRDYLQWLAQQSDLDTDLKHTLSTVLHG